jgi:Mg-chelatase subunit ChlD
MGLVYETSKWVDRLWGEHLGVSEGACGLVWQGVQRQGEGFAGFASDLHARLYLPSDPARAEGEPPQWATQLHEQAEQLGEWQRLRAMCARNGFAAGIAAEALLESLLPLVPKQAPGTPQDGQGAGQGQGQGQPVNASPERVRAAIRRAVGEARDAVEQAEQGLEGLGTACGWSHRTGAPTVSPGPADLAAVRDAHQRLHSSRLLARIAELAGRLERLAVAKQRSEVKPGIGEVYGVAQGADLARLLPSELASLRHPKLRLVALAKLIERRALSYGMKGQEPQARGPIVVLLDESSSMNDGGRDVWSKAVCLALLSTATRQKRAWHLVCFNQGIRREVTVPVGKATPALIAEALDRRCQGNTSFDPPILRAVEIIRTAKSMKRADVVIITDGESDMELPTVEAAQKLTREQGVSWFAVGVGSSAESGIQSLARIATSSVVVHDTNGKQDPIVPVLNLQA